MTVPAASTRTEPAASIRSAQPEGGRALTWIAFAGSVAFAAVGTVWAFAIPAPPAPPAPVAAPAQPPAISPKPAASPKLAAPPPAAKAPGVVAAPAFVGPVATAVKVTHKTASKRHPARKP